MSADGIKLAAKTLSDMQEARRQLLSLAQASGDPSTPSAHQDILLGQMFETAKESVKDIFCELTMMKIN